MTITLLCTAFLLSGSAAPAGEIPAQKLGWLQTMSRRFTPVKDRTSARDLFHFALEATCMNWRPDLVERALQVAERMQDRDSNSTTYGNFRWYWHNEQPVDRNAVEFCMEKGILLRKYHAHQLTSEARTCLERLIRYSVEGIRRHRVSVAYTNIFLMRTWNMIAIGEATGRPDLAEEGYQALDQWLLYTWECGIREYLSPTYYGVDLGSLGLIANHAGRARARHAAEAALRFMWTDVAANWFAPGERLGGAHSRDYDYLTGHSLLDGLVRRHGWIDGSIRPPRDTFQRYSSWQPPASIRKEVATLLPRFVRQRWGSRTALQRG